MKKVLSLILVAAMFLTVQVVPAFADNTVDSYILTAEDEKRLIDYKISPGPYVITNDKVKERVGNYRLYVEVAKDYMELHENYNYREIATEEGFKKYLAGMGNRAVAGWGIFGWNSFYLPF